MTTGMDEWADGRTGRTVTWPDPDAYVLVEGVLLRVLPQPRALMPGTDVTVRRDPSRGRLVGYANTGTVTLTATLTATETATATEMTADGDGEAAPV
ncbi:hypothetical protein ACIPSA_34845 [Streptomyces sp. NPDC086549]|uniref:hypothetical protein n=1 Tax=Streptomyces sp. NPDC086549 TaxID=3365752 RepID=UPI0038268FB6